MPYSFREDSLDRELTKGGMGAAFQGFMGELLAKEHNDIAIYPSKGKDGAIDISREHDGGLVVYECKYIGDETDKTALARWKEVTVNLDKYITSPDGPPSGQGQYRPWYNKDKPISKYEFCISLKLGNESNIQDLEKEIQTYFEEIAKKHNHLSHLSGLKANVFSMNHWEPILRKYPPLILKWYPNLRPNGFSRFEDMKFEGTFRSYLSRGKLPYYSRKQCIESHASSGNSLIQDEDALIKLLETRQNTGLILTGSGGVGKSRSMIELGRIAHNNGWLVLRTTSERTINQNVFSQLASHIKSETKVLFLIDYIETLENFQDFIETLSEYNEQGKLFFRYIGTSRSQYYTKMLQDTPDHKKVDLSPVDSTKQWFEEYRTHTVKHILKASGIEDIDKCLAICHGLPVLAVFLSFLHSENRDDDIGSLIKEQDFGNWVRKRLRMTIGSREVKQNDYNLALLVAQFPMKSVDCLMEPDSTYTNLFHALKKDGWIEKIQDSPDKDEQWAISHDVFADEIIISYLREADLSKQFFKTLFQESYSNDTLHSALVSTERIACHLDDLTSDDWFNIISENIVEKPDRWKELRKNLLMMSMLDLEHKIRLLEQHEMLWTDAEKDLSFHGKLGWMARRLSKNSEPSQDCNQILSKWLKKAVPYATGDNYLINSGLLLCPEEYKDLAFNFICSHTFVFQTHFSIAYWLNKGLPLDSIVEYIHKWLDHYPCAFQVSFIIEAWLQAGGDKEQVWPYLEHWLKVYGEDESARYVYSAWLKAGGDTEQIWLYLENWMKKYSENKSVPFICTAWFNAGGDKEQVWPYLEHWLKVYGEDESARYVYSAWLKAGGNIKQIWSYLKSWLEIHGGDESVQRVYSAWLSADGNKEQIWSYLKSWLEIHGGDERAQHVYSAWLKAGGNKEQIWPYLERWFQQNCKTEDVSYAFRAWVEKEGDFGLIKKYVFEWVKENFELEDCDYTFNQWLDAGGNKEQIWPYLEQWLKKYGLRECASHVFKCWLEANGDKDRIWPYLDRWFQQNCKTEDASFPFRAWIDNEGDFDLIKKYVFEWVKENFELEHCDFKFNQLLDADGNKEQIWPYLKSWLEKYGENERAQYVYSAWLNAGGDKEQIWPYLKSWLEKYGENKSAQHVYSAWLNAGGDKEQIWLYLENWMKRHSENKGVSFICVAWLKADGDVEQIWSYLESWLKVHGKDEIAQRVYSAWLNAKGDIGQIRSYASLLKKHSETENACFVFESRSKSQNNRKQLWQYIESWLEMHCETKNAKYIYDAWFNSGKKIDVLQEYISRWLKKHLSDKKTGHFVRGLAQINPLPEVFVRDILSWCRNYPEDENSLWCITSLSNHLFTEGLHDAVIQTSETLVCQALSKEYNLTEVSVGQINTLFYFLISHNQMWRGQYLDRVNDLFLKWLKCPDSYGYAPTPHKQIQKRNYFIRFKIILRNGKLDILKDASVIERFLQWVNNWHIGNKKLIQQDMNTIKRNYPETPLWDIVKFTD